jgi:hypothetical protein
MALHEISGSIPNNALADPLQEAELEARFAPERIGRLANDFLDNGTATNLRELAGDRQFVVAYIPSDSPYADIPRSVETQVFAKTFGYTLTEIVKDYGKYDPVSTYAAVIDISTEVPTAAGALRICEFDPSLGFKDVNDLVTDDPENPWIDEIKAGYFAPGEVYDPGVAWERLGRQACRDIADVDFLKLDESLDIATHASAEGYNGANGNMGSVSLQFYHACLRNALARKSQNLLAIFDIPPLKNLQQFGDPFRTYEHLKPHPYGGPYDTVPAFCVIQEGMQRIRDNNAYVGDVFINGKDIDKHSLLPKEYQPDIYSDEAVGLV